MRAAWMVGGLFAAALSAQAEAAPKTEAELDKRVAGILVAFGRSAESWKSPSRARAAYRLILEHYDSESAAARAGLGEKRVKDEWQVATAPEALPKDTATPAQKKQVSDAWRVATKRVAALHKALALALDAEGHRSRAIRQFERVLAFEPDDKASHDALGHVEHAGFRGTAEQVAFVQRMHAILGKAREIAAMEIAVDPVDEATLPPELRATGIVFAGARGPHVTFWVAGTAEEAAECVRWNTRAVLLLQFLFGDDPQAQALLVTSPVRWIAVLRSKEQRQRLLEVSPAACAGYTIDRALLFGSHHFTAKAGPAEWMFHYQNDADHVVGQMTKRGTVWFNPGLSEGLVHTMTWLLVGSMHSFYMLLPATKGEDFDLSHRPSVWLEFLREEIERGEDWPLVQVPRERMENFRPPVRVKSWSFVTWLLARHPDRWVRLLVELGHAQRMPEDVAAVIEKVLERDVGEVEAEWRDWARAGSYIGKASGLPQ